jgi:hypothetical protein
MAAAARVSRRAGEGALAGPSFFLFTKVQGLALPKEA